MPVQIGAQAHSFSDPTGLLSDCHRRIEMFLGCLQAVATILDRPQSEQTRTALDSALRYFREAAPKHNADEEESLFPRLRKTGDPRAESVLARLTALEDEHRRAVLLHEKVDQLGRKYLSTKALSASEIAAFRESVDHLVSMYRQHIALEDEVVFPCAAQVLSSADKAAIAMEMAGRRNLSTSTLPDPKAALLDSGPCKAGR
ncbi:MAG TPA: hemerythrin domain-containing protein [Terriglobales bacterium]|nr:hemerythrin domain-containing protein [Terriglobales bacterium]